ncbi:hypothetical protein L9F63_012187, partial [Diploptera punctata]
DFSYKKFAEARQHECVICGKTYKRRHHLVRHLRYECGPARKQQQCTICGKRYSRPDTLQEHYILYHLTSPLLGKTFSLKILICPSTARCFCDSKFAFVSCKLKHLLRISETPVYIQI